MLLKLRILFTILSALCLAVIIPAAVWGGLPWFLACGAAALLFFALMLLCKQAQEKKEGTPPPTEPDFLHPSAPTEKKTDDNE